MQYQNLLELIRKSNKILITSHLSPDGDALGSALFLYSLLKNNFRDKDVHISMEGPLPFDFNFLQHFNEIEVFSLISSLNKHKPDLFIMLDGNNYKRFSKFDFEQVSAFIKETAVKTVIIDHHLIVGNDFADIFINNSKSSTAEDVYTIFKDDLGFNISLDDAICVMTGIVSDTGRFLYKNPYHRDTFKIVSDLIDLGVSIEEISLKLGTLTPTHLNLISELMKNVSQTASYNYSFVTDNFVVNNVLSKIDPDIFISSYHIFMDQYIRNIVPHKWGFVLIPDILGKAGDYKGSFRAVNNLLDTTVFSRLLNGGGHKSASGFKLTANNYQEALDIVHKVIHENLDEALRNK